MKVLLRASSEPVEVLIGPQGSGRGRCAEQQMAPEASVFAPHAADKQQRPPTPTPGSCCDPKVKGELRLNPAAALLSASL